MEFCNDCVNFLKILVDCILYHYLYLGLNNAQQMLITMFFMTWLFKGGKAKEPLSFECRNPVDTRCGF